ncbi:hypothetical protein [Cryobacterium sp. PAMC25264]|uniref:hypothetical protein n=1 Tax=Cryobacterium sp. PAMC25264 TaxID=2861288 RepID=UPI001C625677|nr:hypothetical protein [Cryobacterium sp. PAMC25264]QYF73757.1 hypothetical protein KY500_00205 [Cryobacterium sp. PAMC25264]
MTRRAAAPNPIDEVARIAERLAVLLAAGVSPVSAWDYLVPPAGADPPERRSRSILMRRALGRRAAPRHGPPGRTPVGWFGRWFGRAPTDAGSRAVLLAAARAAHAGDSVSEAIAHEAQQLPTQPADAWRALAAAWEVATQAGAPLAGCLRDLAGAFRDLGQLHRDLTVALTGPRGTARMVLVLPLVALLFGALLGFDTVHTLFFTGPGLGCLAAGLLLMVGASRWNRALVASAGAQLTAPGLELDLTAIGMAGGSSIDRARDVARQSAERFGLRPVHTEIAADTVIDRVLELSARAGIPAGELLRSEADQARRDARSAGRQRGESLGVALMIPLGVCVLPAFMLVGVAPLLLSVLSSTLTAF